MMPRSKATPRMVITSKGERVERPLKARVFRFLPFGQDGMSDSLQVTMC